MIRRQTLSGSVILLAGISLLILALPRFRASINNIPIDNFFASISDNQRLPKLEQIPKYIELSKDSIAQHETAGYWQDLANLWLHQAQIQGSLGNQSKVPIQNASNAARQSLLLSPANSLLSYRLAVISALEKKPPPEIVDLLLISIMSSPHEPGFMSHRLDFCLMYFSAINNQDYPYLVDQIIIFWQHSQKEFLALLQYRNDYLKTIKILLEDKHPVLLNELLTAVNNV